MCRNAKSKKLKNDCVNCKGDSARIWKVINEATNKKNAPNIYPNHIESTVVNTNGKTKTIKVKDKTAIANAMNKQFTEMGGNLAKKLQQTQTKFSDYLKTPSILACSCGKIMSLK